MAILKNCICIVASPGGHLSEAIKAVSKVPISIDRFFVTYDEPHVAERTTPFEALYICHPQRNPLLLLWAFWQSFVIFKKKKPKIIITTGADVGVPISFIGKFFGAKIVYIESGAQIHTPLLTGRIMHPIADLFLVQWEPVCKFYPRSIYGGPLL